MNTTYGGFFCDEEVSSLLLTSILLICLTLYTITVAAGPFISAI